MIKLFIVLNCDNNQYWTGHLYGAEYERWTHDIESAYTFQDENEVGVFLNSKYDEEDSCSEGSWSSSAVEGVRMFEVKVVYKRM